MLRSHFPQAAGGAAWQWQERVLLIRFENRRLLYFQSIEHSVNSDFRTGVSMQERPYGVFVIQLPGQFERRISVTIGPVINFVFKA